MESYKVQEKEESIDILEIFEILRQHLWIIALCAVVFAVVTFALVSIFATPMYQASGLMIVNSKTDNSQATTITNDNLSSAARLVDTYSVIIKSDTVLERVIEEMGLDMTYEELISQIDVSAENDTQIMRVTVTDKDLKLADRICAKILEIAPDIIKEKVEAGSVKVVSQSRRTEDPISPHVGRDTVIMGFFGAVVAIAAIIIIHLFDNKINSETDVAKYLNYSVIGVIPYYSKEKEKK